ncbi:hypothetical protein [Staphylococcus succinus]|nr:hypothetical protein [Staphylococcus succinus]
MLYFNEVIGERTKIGYYVVKVYETTSLNKPLTPKKLYAKPLS